MIVLCYVSARKIYLTGSFLRLLNILLLSNADINILIIHVSTNVPPRTFLVIWFCLVKTNYVVGFSMVYLMASESVFIILQ